MTKRILDNNLITQHQNQMLLFDLDPPAEQVAQETSERYKGDGAFSHAVDKLRRCDQIWERVRHSKHGASIMLDGSFNGIHLRTDGEIDFDAHLLTIAEAREFALALEVLAEIAEQWERETKEQS